MSKVRFRKRIATAAVALGIFFSIGAGVKAAPVSFVPVKLTQPNGQIIECYASGDEFFNYYHDAQGKVIIKNEKTGYYTYAEQVKEDIKATDKVVTPKDIKNAKSLKNAYRGNGSSGDSVVKPNIKLPLDEIKKKRDEMNVPLLNSPISNSYENKGKMNNIVVFIKFSDQENFNDFNQYNDKFNNSSAGANSLRNYYKTTSFNQLDIETHFFPKPNGNTIVTYTDPYPRSYYAQPGYERTTREQTLIKNAIEYVKKDIPQDLNVDFNNDGYVDNMCFIVKGYAEGWSSLLWPHMWSLFQYDEEINGKRVKNYNFQIETYTNVSTLCHEMFHSLGAPDLYSYVQRSITPVGSWDLMAANGQTPQQMGAHMKYKYGKWINEIPEITESGRYTLKSVTSQDNNSYKIKLSDNTNEHFVLEFRNKRNVFDESIPGTGLLISRINPKYNGNTNGTDEVYIYRDGGQVRSDGRIWDANLNQNHRRDSFGGPENPIFYSDGTDSGLKIENIVVSNNSVSFDVKLPGDKIDDEIKELPFNGSVQSIESGSILSGNYNIYGWYVYGKGISKVEILVDNRLIGEAKLSSLYDISDSIKKQLEGYDLNKAKYEYNLDTTQFENGRYAIIVRATGKDGKTDELRRSIRIENEIIDDNNDNDDNSENDDNNDNGDTDTETNSTFENAKVITFNTKVSDKLNKANHQDVFTFDVTSQEELDITVSNKNNAGMNWLLYHESDLKNYVSYPQTGGNELKGKYKAKPGKYYIVIYLYSGDNASYTVKVDGQINDSDDDNDNDNGNDKDNDTGNDKDNDTGNDKDNDTGNDTGNDTDKETETGSNSTFETAKVITANSSISDELNRLNNKEVFYFNVTSEGELDITVSNKDNSGMNWLLYHESDLNNYVSYPQTGDRQLKGIYKARPGKYYLVVYLYSGDNAPYTIDVDGPISSSDDDKGNDNGSTDTESNSTFESAKEITYNSNISGKLNNANNRDVFCFDVTSQGELDITVSNKNNEGMNWLLYHESDLNNYVSYAQTGDLEMKGKYKAKPGKYYLVVYLYSGDNAPYALDIDGPIK